MILSDYAFGGYDQGPPSAGGNAIAAVTCGTGTWECEDRWPCGRPGHGPATGAVETVTVPVKTAASADTVYLAANLSALGLG
jgi:hypothetical protein